MQLKNELYQISCLDFLLGSAGLLRSELWSTLVVIT